MGIFDAFTGSAQKRDIQQGAAAQRQAIMGGRDRAREAYGQRYGDALGYLSEDIGAGRTADELYRAGIGALGESADDRRDNAQGFYDEFTSDPGYRDALDARTAAIEGSAAARGGLRSGRTLNAIADHGQRFRTQHVQTRLDRLRDLAQRGTAARGTAAQYAFQQGGDIAGLEFGTGQLLGNNRMAEQQAVAGTRGIGYANGLNLLGTVAKAVAAGA